MDDLQRYLYGIILISSLVGLWLIDRHWRLAWPKNRRATILSVAGGVVFLLAGDLAGLSLEIFATNQQFVSGLNLGSPNLPVEEVLLLSLICYLALLVYVRLDRTA